MAESHSFDLEGFLPLLQEYLTVGDPYKRQFLLSWLGLLDSLPDISLVNTVMGTASVEGRLGHGRGP